MYQNCAVIHIQNGGTGISSLPDMFVADIGISCLTPTGDLDVRFPDPGIDTVYDANYRIQFPSGPNCAPMKSAPGIGDIITPSNTAARYLPTEVDPTAYSTLITLTRSATVSPPLSSVIYPSSPVALPSSPVALPSSPVALPSSSATLMTSSVAPPPSRVTLTHSSPTYLSSTLVLSFSLTTRLSSVAHPYSSLASLFSPVILSSSSVAHPTSSVTHSTSSVAHPSSSVAPSTVHRLPGSNLTVCGIGHCYYKP